MIQAVVFQYRLSMKRYHTEGAMQATVFFIRQEFCHNLKWSEMLFFFSQVPVACKSCPCGYIFISRKLLHAKRAERSPPIAGNTDEGPEGGDNSSFSLFLGSRAQNILCLCKLVGVSSLSFEFLPIRFNVSSILRGKVWCFQSFPLYLWCWHYPAARISHYAK